MAIEQFQAIELEHQTNIQIYIIFLHRYTQIKAATYSNDQSTNCLII